jgi:hypothetical protein
MIGFKNLETLKLCPWYSIEPTVDTDSTDPEYDTAMMIINRLMDEKQGKPFKSISIIVEFIMDAREYSELPYKPTIFSVVIENGIVVETGDKRLHTPPTNEAVDDTEIVEWTGHEFHNQGGLEEQG